MSNLIEDLSTLTTIAKYNLDSLVNKSISIISHDVEESLRELEDLTEIDLGIGTLFIQHKDTSIKYRFIPCRKLDETLVNTYNTRKSNLVLEVDEALRDRIEKTYKDLF